MMQDMSMMLQTARRSNVTLARASELQQPMPPGHFLSKFGQSERNFVVGAAGVEVRTTSYGVDEWCSHRGSDEARLSCFK